MSRRKKRSNKVNLTDLPTELLLEIFNFLPRSDLLPVRLVNKEFKAIFRLAKAGKVYEGFFTFYNNHEEDFKKLKSVDEKDGNEPLASRDLSSIEILQTGINRLKWTLEARELWDGYVWELEKKAFSERKPKKKKGRRGRRKKMKQPEFIRRSEVVPRSDRVILTTKEKEDEFSRLCESIYIPEFEGTKCEGKRCDQAYQNFTIRFEKSFTEGNKKGKKCEVEMKVSHYYHYNFGGDLSIKLYFKDEEVMEDLEEAGMVTIHKRWVQKGRKIGKGYFVKTKGGCSLINESEDSSFGPNMFGWGFTWENFRSKFFPDKVKIFEEFRNVMDINHLSDDNVAYLLLILSYAFRRQL